MRRAWVVVLALFLTVPVCAADVSLEEALQAELAAFLAENPMAPGVSAAVLCPGLGLNWEGAVGTIAQGSTEPLTPGHTFRIASNTKSYVAAAVLRLVERGQLKLDALLETYLDPNLARSLQGDGYDLDTITLSHVLSHTAGLNDHTRDPRYLDQLMSDPQHRWTSREQLQALVEWTNPLCSPGEAFNYSDSGYVILGTILERQTGKTLGPAVRDLVGFEDLGLGQTYWEILESPPEGAAPRAHQYFGEQDVTDWDASFDLYGGGGLIADVGELTRFMRLLVKGRVLTQESMMAMTGRGKGSYRLGLSVQEFEGHLAWGHSGFWNTFAYHLPSLDLTLGGSILNHQATPCHDLVARLIGVVSRSASQEGAR
jgi:D-alanyl-D-alanine carboxypeptidase